MDNIIVYGELVIGFIILIWGADLLVSGAVSIAKKFKIPDFIVGLTVVSFGTSLPELIINVISSYQGSSEIAIGNILGSNVSNVLLILGVSAIIRPLPIQKKIILSEIPFTIIAALLVGFLANASLSKTPEGLLISRIDGGVLMFFFALFMLYVINSSSTNKEENEDHDFKDLKTTKAFLYIGLGVLGLHYGGQFVVESSIDVAKQFGFSETFIGLTIVALGTSLPELVTSALAAYRRSTDIALGNVIGSNIFNLLWVLGLSAIINPLPFDRISNFYIMMVIFSSTLILVPLTYNKKSQIDKYSGSAFISVYLVYIVFLFYRG